MNTPKEIGNYLKQLRKDQSLTQADVSEKIGIDKSTYAQFETGRTNMTLSTLNRIANVLGYELQIGFKRIVDK